MQLLLLDGVVRRQVDVLGGPCGVGPIALTLIPAILIILMLAPIALTLIPSILTRAPTTLTRIPIERSLDQHSYRCPTASTHSRPSRTSLLRDARKRLHALELARRVLLARRQVEQRRLHELDEQVAVQTCVIACECALRRASHDVVASRRCGRLEGNRSPAVHMNCLS